LIVKPRRHVLHVADLTEREAAELGPLLRATSAAVTKLTDAEQVYVTLWSHAGGTPGHIHFVVQPVTRATLDEFGLLGPHLQVAIFDRGEPPEEAPAAAFAARAREVFRLAEGVAKP
jgi:diadenosine tetraphosphate (Ap4A) HIT family hydrolase